MYKTAPYRAVALLILGSVASLSAQNFNQATRGTDIRPLAVDDLEGRDPQRFSGSQRPGDYQVPATKAAANLPDGTAVYLAQDSATLASSRAPQRSVENVVDLAPLRESSPYRKSSTGLGGPVSEADAKDLSQGLALISATYRPAGESAAKSDCAAVGLSVQQRVKLDLAQVLEAVEKEISANPGCACEIVKAALNASGADVELTARIVETAATTAPETMRLVSQCAIAVVPESLATVQAVLAKLDPNSGEGPSSKSGKEIVSAKSAKEPLPQPPKINPLNPLDLPPIGPPLVPPPVYPPPVTAVDPRGSRAN